MGRQIHPRSFRLGVSTSWDSQWYGIGSSRQEHNWNHELEKIRQFIRVSLQDETCRVGRIYAEMQPLRCTLHVKLLSTENNQAKCQEISKQVIRLLRRKKIFRLGTQFELQWNNVAWIDMDATLLSEWIALECEKSTPFRPLRKIIQEWFQEKEAKGLMKGIRVQIKGRIQGAEMANKEWFHFGKVSLQTITNRVDYSQARAYTLSGVLGVKVWLV